MTVNWLLKTPLKLKKKLVIERRIPWIVRYPTTINWPIKKWGNRNSLSMSVYCFYNVLLLSIAASASYLPCLQFQTSSLYCGSSPNGHSRKRKSLLTATFTKVRFSQLPYKLSNLHSDKRPAPVTDTFFASRGCPLTRVSTVIVIELSGAQFGLKSQMTLSRG